MNHNTTSEQALHAAIRRFHKRPQSANGPLEATILDELGRIRRRLEQLEQIILVRIYLAIDGSFNAEELHQLAFNLALDPDNLPGQTKDAQIRNLITTMQRHGRIDQLLQEIRRQRPGSQL